MFEAKCNRVCRQEQKSSGKLEEGENDKWTENELLSYFTNDTTKKVFIHRQRQSDTCKTVNGRMDHSSIFPKTHVKAGN